MAMNENSQEVLSQSNAIWQSSIVTVPVQVFHTYLARVRVGVQNVLPHRSTGRAMLPIVEEGSMRCPSRCVDQRVAFRTRQEPVHAVRLFSLPLSRNGLSIRTRQTAGAHGTRGARTHLQGTLRQFCEARFSHT